MEDTEELQATLHRIYELGIIVEQARAAAVDDALGCTAPANGPYRLVLGAGGT